MCQSNNLHQVSPPDQTVRLNRRQLLKALAVSGVGLGAALALPAEWVKPVVEVGVLPAHAQTSLAAWNISCHINQGVTPFNVPQDGVITHIQVNVPPIYPPDAKLKCAVATSDANYPADQFTTLQTPARQPVFPDFNLPLEVGRPAIAEGSTITFEISFVNQKVFGYDSCFTTIKVGSPTGTIQINANAKPQWRK